MATTKLTHAQKAGMTEAEWKEAIKFDGTDWGWVIMSISAWLSAPVSYFSPYR